MAYLKLCEASSQDVDCEIFVLILPLAELASKLGIYLNDVSYEQNFRSVTYLRLLTRAALGPLQKYVKTSQSKRQIQHYDDAPLLGQRTMKHNRRHIFRLLHQLLDLVFECIRRRVDAVDDMSALAVIIAHINDDVVRMRLCVALQQCRQLLQ